MADSTDSKWVLFVRGPQEKLSLRSSSGVQVETVPGVETAVSRFGGGHGRSYSAVFVTEAAIKGAATKPVTDLLVRSGAALAPAVAIAEGPSIEFVRDCSALGIRRFLDVPTVRAFAVATPAVLKHLQWNDGLLSLNVATLLAENGGPPVESWLHSPLLAFSRNHRERPFGIIGGRRDRHSWDRRLTAASVVTGLLLVGMGVSVLPSSPPGASGSRYTTMANVAPPDSYSEVVSFNTFAGVAPVKQGSIRYSPVDKLAIAEINYIQTAPGCFARIDGSGLVGSMRQTSRGNRWAATIDELVEAGPVGVTRVSDAGEPYLFGFQAFGTSRDGLTLRGKIVDTTMSADQQRTLAFSCPII